MRDIRSGSGGVTTWIKPAVLSTEYSVPGPPSRTHSITPPLRYSPTPSLAYSPTPPLSHSVTLLRGITGILTVALALAWPGSAAAQRFATGGPYNTPAGASPTAAVLRDVGIEQHLDAQLPLDAEFRDEEGKAVRLGDYFKDQPVVLALVYYRCPMLCTQVLNGFLTSSQAIPLEIGSDYQVVTVSIDPRETPVQAAQKKDRYAKAYRRPGAQQGWHFLTGEPQSIDRLCEAVGFRYHYDPPSGQFAHASGIVVATPGGRLAHYFYGIEYSPRDLRLGLVESSAGRVGSPADQVLLLCYHYDPLTGKYGLAISGALRLAGLLTLLVLACFLVAMFRRERKRPKLVRGLVSAMPAADGRSDGVEEWGSGRVQPK